MSPPVKVLMLDVDGVLVDGRPADGRHHFADLKRDLGLSRERLQAEFFHSPDWDQVLIGRAALADRLAPVLARIAPQVTAGTLIEYWFRNDARIDPAVLDSVRALRRSGIAVFLATNQEHLRARYLMEEMRLGAEVDGIIYAAALGYRKPQPEFFQLAAARATVPAEAIILVDDYLPNVQAARRAGWRAAQWMPGRRLEALVAPD